jgi:glycosyltransferase involved in cell wall biosynthesis
LRVVPEKSPGLSNARITGIKAARHDVIIFCDDDNWLCPAYASTAQEILNKDPRIALAGGMTQAVIAPEKEPKWFPQIAGAYAVGGAEGRCEIKIGESVWGAGLVARKSALIELYQSGFKFLCVGRRGSVLSCGEDGEMCHALQWMGHTVYYDGRLKLKHFIPNNRLTWSYAVRMAKGWGAATIHGDAIRLAQNKNQKLRNAIRKSFIYHLVRGGIAIIAQIKVLASLNNSEGNISGLSAASTLGRWQAIAGLNVTYSKVVEEKASWLERTKSKSTVITN